MGRSPAEGHSNPLRYSCLENPVVRGAWRATVLGVTEFDTSEATEQAGMNVFQTIGADGWTYVRIQCPGKIPGPLGPGFRITLTK